MEITKEEYLKALDVVERYHRQIKEDTQNALSKNHKTIKDLNLSARAQNAIRAIAPLNIIMRYGTIINRVPLSELGFVTFTQLAKLKSVGNKTIYEIQDALKKEGISIE